MTDVDTDAAPMIAALCKARAEFPEIPKRRTAVVRMKSGGQYSYSYADLADVLSAVAPILSAHGLFVSQYPESEHIVTEIMHESGATKTTRWPIKPMPKQGLEDAQAFQAAIQVAKRYALTAALGISTEDTVEGDPRAAQKAAMPRQNMDENFATEDGIRHPVGATFTREMTPRQKAEEAARAIEAQMDAAKTIVGVNGVWNRNEMFVERLRENHADLFNNLFEKMAQLTEDNSEEDAQ